MKPQSEPFMTEEPIGIVLANNQSRPLEFWIELRDGAPVQLDDLITLELRNPVQPDLPVRLYGVVDDIVDHVEGLSFPGDTQAYAQGLTYGHPIMSAHVRVTRYDPDVLRPPQAGTPAFLARGEHLRKAMYVDKMGAGAMPIGVLRNGQPAYVNFEFIDGTAGGHINISGISGVATKTSFALWTLYSILNAKRAADDGREVHVDADRHRTKAIIFNVKGTDLFYLDKPNRDYRETELRIARQFGLAQTRYQTVGLPEAPFERVAVRTPPETTRGDALVTHAPGPCRVTPYAWTLAEFCTGGMLPMMFALDPGSQTLQYLIEDVTERLAKAVDVRRTGSGPWVRVRPLPSADGEQRRASSGSLRDGGRIASDDAGVGLDDIDGTKLTSLEDLAQYLDDALMIGGWAQAGRHADGTCQAFLRRFKGACKQIGHLIRGDLGRDEMQRAHLDPLTSPDMVHVIDIHNLQPAAQAFVVGVVLKNAFAAKEAATRTTGKVFVVLDELNKYAPAQGESPIKDVLLDIAERGRSLGVILIGAQQTASEVERRIVGNAAIRVVGRLDMAEALRPEYRFLPSTLQGRAGILNPGSMIVHQPDIPTPLLITFPYPTWATRAREVDENVSDEEFGALTAGLS